MHSSTISHSRKPARSSVWIALCLMLCLLFAQWLGYSHAISHAGIKTEALSSQPGLSISTSLSTSSFFDHQTASNACTSLDAATLGASLHSPAVLPLLLTGAAMMADAIPQHIWLQAFTALFSSRAPPRCH